MDTVFMTAVINGVLTPERKWYHGFDSVDHLNRAVIGRCAHVAAQPKLGVRPQRHIGTGVNHRAGPPAPGIPPPRLLTPGAASLVREEHAFFQSQQIPVRIMVAAQRGGATIFDDCIRAIKGKVHELGPDQDNWKQYMGKVREKWRT